ncbi:Hsp20 family protein [Azospirillum sp. RWY-5-1]|uniref:Hsp20 family protein n=1 Tax=Azospirillum oleiclasticum TaxID=2735135 RepID=A0ABX2T429_9PROT|nr:Hsp20 family protein [Azospirillum oleiclasticum]NYZ11920.1 Hsp20 family protein [Azospirillum oleiclasticum]NYZ19080.1 Hsp20 family protein [Azospirillum oleiclasticum]
MRAYDLSPLFRSTVGFDRLSRLLESATSVDDATASYPPYNIEKLGEDSYRITMAVAGFGPEDVEITAQQNSLVITGKAKKEVETGQFLYRGIAGRAFERRFQLADFIKVTGASMVNGLLHVDLAREIPEAMKPRTIRIETQAQGKPVLTQQAA